MEPIIDVELIGEVKPNYRRAVALRIDMQTAEVSAKKTLEKMKESYKRFKSVGHCEHCGYENIFMEARYCPMCGEEV